MKKLVDQLDMDWNAQNANGSKKAAGNLSSESKEKSFPELSEEKATLLFILDIYNKHLFDIEKHNMRKVREQLDAYSKDLVNPHNPKADMALFNIRQFFSTYRIDEYTYMQSNLEEFKRIIWEFADQLGEELRQEKKADDEMNQSLEDLREAVEANSVETLKKKSKEFITAYKEHQSTKDERRTKRLAQVRKSLNSVKKQLLKANETALTDHMTGAQNRRSFDDQVQKTLQMYNLDQAPVSLVFLDIDHFKKVNDTYGHDIGDFVIKECVRMTKETFNRSNDFIARLGGEEFAIILPDYTEEAALKKCEELMAKIRKEVFIHGEHQIRFTISMGVCEAAGIDNPDLWLKRSDESLYFAKQNGRNQAIPWSRLALKTVA